MLPNRVFECSNTACMFRFTIGPGAHTLERCPRCGSGEPVLIETYDPARPPYVVVPNAPLLEAVLDNIRSGYNVGSMFRSADGAGVARLHLCGISPTPDQPVVSKTSLGAEQSVPWVYHRDCRQAVVSLLDRDFRIWALEGGRESVPFYHLLPEALNDSRSIALVCGNEVTGIDPEVLALSHRKLSIPMQGVKNSLNVSVAFGIAAYFIRSATFLTSQDDHPVNE